MYPEEPLLLKAKSEKRWKEKERQKRESLLSRRFIRSDSYDELCSVKPKHSHKDFIQFLPVEVRECILLYLDNQALTAACCVSKTWNKLITPCYKVWRQACQRLNLIVADEEKGISDNNYWRALFLQMHRRRRQMVKAESFFEKTYKTPVPLTAVYYHDGKLATVSPDTTKIKIWDCASFSCLQTVTCYSWITSVKFDNSVIMAATDHRGIKSWDVAQGLFKSCYVSESDFVSCFDYLTDADLVVGGFHNCSINIWLMSTGERQALLCDHSSAVGKVELRLYPVVKDEEQHTLLLSMDHETIFVRLLTFFLDSDSTVTSLTAATWYKISYEYRSCIPRRFAPKTSHYIRLIAQSADSISLLYPKCIFTESCGGFLSSVLHFDGEFLYFAFNGDCVSLCKWDLKRACMVTETDRRMKIQAMVGVGKKYMAFVASREKEELFLLAIDKETKETIACCPLPMNAQDKHLLESKSPCLRLCLCDESWLDGFDGRNDQGVVLASVLEYKRLFILEWLSKEQYKC